MIRFRMLGTVDLRDSQGRELSSVLRRPKLLALLGYLTSARPRGFHRRDTLLALLWPELDHVHARNALSQAVHALRQGLGRDVLLARGEEELGVSEEGLTCDVRELTAALEAGQAEPSLELYRGELLGGLHVSDVPEFERWLDQEREFLRRRACEAAQLLTAREEAAGNATGAAHWAHRLTELSPFDESAVRTLIELLDRTGDRAGAVRAFEEFERRLGRDLEVQPSSETRALVEGIRTRQETAGAVVSRAIEAATGPVRSVPRVRAGRRRVTLVLALVVVGLLGGGWFVFRPHPAARGAEAAGDTKRIVVLPFANLGPADEDYFTDGITEEITTRLATVAQLRVIGRTSANAYKNTNKTLREIGTELEVDYVVEGAVRWERSPQGSVRVRITPQLVSTADGTHLWAQVYDEPLDEIFKVQSDIAQSVAQALDLTLLEPQRQAVQAIPTRDLQAYDYYLRGNQYWRCGPGERFQATALRMYEKAVQLDTGFALAYAMLSRMHSRMYLFHYDWSPDRLVRAKQAVDRALRLAPDLTEAHHSLGTYYWLGLVDYDRALQEFAIVEATRPNDVDLLLARAVLRQRQGKLHESLLDFERLQQLDPAFPAAYSNCALTYLMLRDFPHAEALYDRAIALGPDNSEFYFAKAMLYLRWDGSTRKARAVLDDARAVGLADEPYTLLAQAWVEMFDRRYPAAIELLSSKVPEVLEDQNQFVPRALLYAQVYGLMQRHGLERAYYDSARVLLVRKLAQWPADPRLRSALGIAYAGLGRQPDAIREGRTAVELLPIGKEAHRGYRHAWDLARIYTMVGESDSAIAQLRYLLSIPGYLTTAWLRVDPTWDPLRGDPRFQRLLATRQ